MSTNTLNTFFCLLLLICTFNNSQANNTPSPTNTNAIIIPMGDTWSYLDDGSNQGTAWKEPGFDDSTWASGPAQLGYGDGDEATIVSYGNAANNKHTTAYFRKTFNIANTSDYGALELTLLFDDGAIVYINGLEVLRQDLPSGTVTYTTFANGISADNRTATTELLTAYLQNGSNTIAVEIHQRTLSSSDISFDLQLESITGDDADADGIADNLECTTIPCQDTDLDGTPDYLDTDDDNDGIPTLTENLPAPDNDIDGDLIPNHLDTDSDDDTLLDSEECPTIPCANTDGSGYPNYLDTDSDSDGTPDIDDGCPTIYGSPQTIGCPDADGDGIPNINDDCPYVAGLISANGCPDADGDTVGDPFDDCPNTPGNPCAQGCPDADNDCVSDINDLCPNTPGSIPASGCPDADNDGIVDTEDTCPNAAGLACTDGCPDADSDCFEDTIDACPTLAGVASANGCPDADGDTIQDADDDCPLIAGLLSANGCPDADGDTVGDPLDLCPNTPGTVCASGCPDSDGDCTGDIFDDCPNTVGPTSANGCPDLQRGPYLQKLTPSSIVVKWRTGSANQSTVFYGTSPSSLTNSASSNTTTTEHEVEITDLQPNTIYYYGIGDTNGYFVGGDTDHYFKTAPNIGDEGDYRLWVLGDCGTANNNQRAVRNAYYNFNGNRHTDAILMLGDNAYGQGTEIQYQAAVFENMYEDKLINSVLWSCPGNHEFYNGNTDSDTQQGPYFDIFTFPTNGEAGGLASGTEAYYSFDYGNIHIISLDSHDSNKSPGSTMLTWLENDLANTTQKWIIAIWHHPAYSKGSHDSDTEASMVQMRENVVPILEEYGVDLVMSGHSHSYERSYLMKGQYDVSSTFDPDIHAIDQGWGRADVDSVYTKTISGVFGGEGAVYATAGSSGKITNAPLDHPIMKTDFVQLGSMVLDVKGDTMDVKFVNNSSVTTDYFTIVKDDTNYNTAHDTDGDSVPDIVECPDGFPCQDSDNDGLQDYLDTDDDNDGIPTVEENIAGFTDIDGDNIPNYLDLDADADNINDADECTTSPCENTDNDNLANFLDTDSDNDGVLDADDDCPVDIGTASNGCPDNDNDGINDEDDDCPNQVGPVCTNGCPDNDNDCVANDIDNCPEVSGTIANNGCPGDADNDGIIDTNDDCPNHPGPVCTNGCPDNDNDCIANDIDFCPEVSGTIANNGCPDDTDNDGIDDTNDNCPNHPGPVCTNGCPDNDNDCVANAIDDCPEVGGTSNNNGCPTIIRGPYIQKLTSTSVVVKWRTDVAISSGVMYRPSGVGNISTVSSSTPTIDHEIEITGLNPDSKYYYQVGNESTVLTSLDPSIYFQTSPPIGQAGNYDFWVLGDCGTANNNARSVRNAFYSKQGNDHVDGILMLGDNAYGSGTDAQYQYAVFENMYEDKLKNSVLWSTRGNHEYFGNVYYDIFTFPTAGEAGGLASGTEAYYSFDYGNIHFVVLDSYGSDRSVGGPMLTWLENDLAQTTQQWIIAFWHHPPYTKGSHDSDIETQLIQMRENALPILEDAGVDLVLSGHSHSYERSKFIKGHFDNSTTFDSNTMVVQEGAGQTTPYCKQEAGIFEGHGTVYITAGSSGKISGGPLNHPIMHASINSLGSIKLSINDATLKGEFITPTGDPDYFTIIKKDESLADTDNDGILDVNECPTIPCRDFDGDGTPDYDDTDSDNDGISDADECPNGIPCTNTDGSAAPDYLDTDSDNDGLTDSQECPNGIPCPVSMPGGIADHLNPDIDNDGILDGADACITISGDATANGCPDADGDAIADQEDVCPNEFGEIAFGGCPCARLNLKVLLEGPMDSLSNTMTTYLSSSRKILPGQTPVNSLVTPTPPGQPYNTIPWNYTGTEGATFGDADYPADVVDWVLVSLRTSTQKSTEIAKTAALLLKDGTILGTVSCPVQNSQSGPFYIVIEHRNHMGIMSPNPVSITDGQIMYDFSTQDSYRDPTSVGQKEIQAGVWAMYAGDLGQSSDIESYDINGGDKAIWENDNGQFDQYIPADTNLDGDINGADKIPWENNNGNSSRVPRD